MRRQIAGFAVCLCVLAGNSQAALAADIPIYKARPAPMVAVPFSWTGIYIGGHVGYGWAKKDWTAVFGPPFDAGSHTATGWLGGIQGGADYQIGSWVVGIEGQYSWANLRGSHISLVDVADTLGTEVKWLATVAGRIGYAFDRTLVYGKGGGAWIRDEYTKVDLGVLEGVASETRSGWLLGAGIEHMFWQNWSAKLEYNYMHFGTKRVTLIDPAGGAPDFFDIKQRVQTITLGLNYRFWSGSPLMTRF